MPLKKLKELLDSNKIKYVLMSHSPAYTAQQVAQTSHVSGYQMAKTVMVKLDGKLVMVVIPATNKVNFDIVKKNAKASKAELASENEFKSLFPGCEVGAMPPFGNLFNVDVLVAESMAQNKEIAFNAGSHSEVMKLAYKDFKKVVKPKVMKGI